jgi:hypothetical protein
MGAFGKGRFQLQVLNQYDSCCFDGTGFKTYVDLVRKRVHQLEKGRYDVFLDNSHREHKISERAIKEIFNKIQISKTK